ncbi:hypothetical protein FACS189485_02820 [Spirochaetia bacterium]|nr:hypothetical protein FACS189485_02820 [Spirochaetia bacterium]
MRELDSKLNQKPQVNLSRPTAVRMWLVCFCALAAVIQSSLTDRGSSVEIALVAFGSAVFAELLVSYRARAQGGTGSGVHHNRIADGSAAASALILALLLPNTIHPVYAGFGAAFAMAVIKYSFGGLGSNWVNPALGGWLFIRFSWPAAFENVPDGLASGGWPGLDTAVSSFLNSRIFSLTGSELPGGYIDRLFFTVPGIIADRGLCALLFGTILVTASQANRSWIPAAYLGLYALLIRVFGAFAEGGALGEGDILFGFFSGGTIATAFLLAADPATGAKSDAGMLAAVIMGAVFSFVFRYVGGEVYGAFFAIALVNALMPLIRSIENRKLYFWAGDNREGKGL